MRVRWLLKAVLPLAIVLTAGVGIFIWATIALDPSERRSILFVAGGGAAIITAKHIKTMSTHDWLRKNAA